MLLPLCNRVQMGTEIKTLTSEILDDYTLTLENMARDGLRVLAFAWRELDEGHHEGVEMEQNMVLCGMVGLEDPPRPEVKEAISQCREAGIKVIMVTGDHPHTALAIGRQIGQIQSEIPVIITGEQLRKLSEIQLRLALD